MQIKLLTDILGNIIGRQAGEVVNLLADKKNVNEFIIAKKLKLTINQTRNLLYKLADAGVVSSTRKKDKRKGWYTYFWTLDSEKSLELLESNVSKEMDNLRTQLKNRESKRYYICNTCKTEVNEETALLHSFICVECGEVYALQEDKKLINDLAAKIKKVEGNFAVIKEELGKIRENESKKAMRKERKEAKAKGRADKARRKANKLKRKSEGKSSKIKKKKKKI